MAELKTISAPLALCHIRPLVVADIATIAAMHQHEMAHGWSETLWHETLGERYLSRVALVNEQLVGVVVFSAVIDEAELQMIMVSSSHQGLGIGASLLNESLPHLITRHIRSIFLEVDANNAPAIGLYARNGFVNIGVRQAYYIHSTGNGDALLMQKTLQPE